MYDCIIKMIKLEKIKEKIIKKQIIFANYTDNKSQYFDKCVDKLQLLLYLILYIFLESFLFFHH